MNKAKNKKLNFEDALSQLEEIVDTLEQGDLALEEALAHFEKGVGISKHCHHLLAEFEQKITVITQENNKMKSSKFKEDKDND